MTEAIVRVRRLASKTDVGHRAPVLTRRHAAISAGTRAPVMKATASDMV